RGQGRLCGRRRDTFEQAEDLRAKLLAAEVAGESVHVLECRICPQLRESFFIALAGLGRSLSGCRAERRLLTPVGLGAALFLLAFLGELLGFERRVTFRFPALGLGLDALLLLLALSGDLLGLERCVAFRLPAVGLDRDALLLILALFDGKAVGPFFLLSLLCLTLGDGGVQLGKLHMGKVGI